MRAPPLTSLATASLHVPPPERALVIGCGDGEAVLYLAREFPAARVRGVDRSSTNVREAIARVGLDPEGRVAFKQGGGTSLPYPDDLFDLVVLLERRVATAEVARVLRPGGHLIVVDPRPVGTLASVRTALWQRMLARRGVEPLAGGDDGDGNFFVGRLAGGE